VVPAMLIPKKIISIGAVLFLFSPFSMASDAAEQIKFDINGIELGDKLSEVFFNKYCPSKYKGKSEIECKQKISLDGINLSIIYFYYDAKLLAISIDYPSFQYGDLIKTYTRKFNKSPHNNKQEAILISTGEEYTNKQSSWKTMSGEFVIEKYGNNFKRGIAYLSSFDYEEYKIKKNEAINPEFLDKLFGDIFNI
jgi:hypothetical protein